MKLQTVWPPLTAALAFALLLGACAPAAEGAMGAGQENGASQDVNAPPASVVKLTPEEAKSKMDQEDVTIVDVRTGEEYQEGHVPGAVLLPNETIDEESAKALLPDQDEILLVYCRSGRRSSAASEKLAELGYTRVYDFGGINDWPYDTETGEFAP